MRYIKLLIFAVFFFLAMVFFFQNQAPLSQEMVLTLNLFFIPTMTSISLPFYFIVIAAFFIGCLLAMCFLWWDKMNASARYVKAKWKISHLEGEVEKLRKELNEALAAAPAPAQSGSFFHRKKQEPLPPAQPEDAPKEAAKEAAPQKS